MAKREADVLVTPVVVVDAQRAPVSAAVAFGGQLQDRGELKIHQIAAHLIGAVADAFGVVRVRRTQQDHRGVHGPGRHHHHISAEQPDISVNLRLHPLHLASGRIHIKSQNPGVVADGEPVWISGFKAEQLGIAARVVPIFGPADRNVVRLASLALQRGSQGFEERLHRLGLGHVITVAARLGGVHPRLAVHPVQLLRLLVVRRQFAVVEWPGRRDPLLKRNFAEVLLAHALEHSSPDLGVAAAGVGGLGREGIAVRPEPAFVLGVVAVLAEQIHVGDVLVLESHGPAALQHQHGFALAAEGTGQGAATGSAADDDDVVMAVVDDHGITARRR